VIDERMTSLMPTVKRPRCEYCVDRLGTDERFPRLRWTRDWEARGETQSAYRIPAARSEDVENRLWASGRGEPYCSVGVEYGDEVLRSGSRFTWEGPVLVGIRNPSPCSVPVVFETGLLKRSKWKEARVSAGDGPDLSMSGRYEFEGRMARG
jgi:alpha-L-rhamnosidase